jgi:hypothetical protein
VSDDREQNLLEAKETLEELRVECQAYIAKHYEPWDESRPDEEYHGSWSDDEFVWDQAIQSVLGPTEWWEQLYECEQDRAKLDAFWEQAETYDQRSAWFDRFMRVNKAYLAVALEAIQEAGRQDQEEHLFGKVLEKPRPLSPEWTAMFTMTLGDDEGKAARPFWTVFNYLGNVKGGAMDATGAFMDLEEDDPDAEAGAEEFRRVLDELSNKLDEEET